MKIDRGPIWDHNYKTGTILRFALSIYNLINKKKKKKKKSCLVHENGSRNIKQKNNPAVFDVSCGYESVITC